MDCDIEHWRPDAIRICLDTLALQPLAMGRAAGATGRVAAFWR